MSSKDSDHPEIETPKESSQWQNVGSNPAVLNAIITEYNLKHNENHLFTLINVIWHSPSQKLEIIQKVKLPKDSIESKLLNNISEDYAINLSHCHIGDCGVKYLSNNFRFLLLIKKLNLEDNDITNDGLLYLSYNIDFLKSLESLNLSHNNFNNPFKGYINERKLAINKVIPLFEEWKTLLEDISNHIKSNETMSLYEKLKVEKKEVAEELIEKANSVVSKIEPFIKDLTDKLKTVESIKTKAEEEIELSELVEATNTITMTYKNISDEYDVVSREIEEYNNLQSLALEENLSSNEIPDLLYPNTSKTQYYSSQTFLLLRNIVDGFGLLQSVCCNNQIDDKNDKSNNGLFKLFNSLSLLSEMKILNLNNDIDEDDLNTYRDKLSHIKTIVL